MAPKNEAGSKKSGGLVPALVATGLAIVVGFGAGYGAVTFSAPAFNMLPQEDNATALLSQNAPDADQGSDKKSGNEGIEADQVTENEEGDSASIDPADIDFAMLPPVIVNLREPKQVWLRLEGGISYAKSGPKKSELLVAESAQQIAQYLKTLNLSDIEGPDGLQFLQEDVNGIVKALSDGQVDRVLLSGIVIE
jgi:flagellar protein FliL